MAVSIRKSFGFFYFLAFYAAVLGAYLFYQPSWGAMDDHTYLNHARFIWESGDVPQAFVHAVIDDWKSQKMRPIFVVYATLVYKFFADYPTLLYCLIFLAVGSVLPLWGIIFHRCFAPGQKAEDRHIFLFPLTFFLFPPFWNIFMYVSIQEKFIFFFGTFAVYFLVDSYQKRIKSSAVLAFLFTFLAMLSKPIGIYLLALIVSVAALDLVLTRTDKKLSAVYFAAGSALLLAYYLLVSRVVGDDGYSTKYVRNLSAAGILEGLQHASIVLKILLAAALIFLANLLRAKDSLTIVSFIPVLGYVVFVVILAPWGLVNYLLGPATPFIFGIFYPLYLKINSLADRTKFRHWPTIAITVVTLIFLFQIIVPRINKIAEIKHVVRQILFIKEQHPDARFFFAPPVDEARSAISEYSRTPVELIRGDSLTGEKLTGLSNFLIVRDESNGLNLMDVAVAANIFQNKTWHIFRIERAPGVRERITAEFPKTLLQRLTESLRDN